MLQNKKYECLVEIIAVHLYDYFMRKPHIRQLKERMINQIITMIDVIVKTTLINNNI